LNLKKWQQQHSLK
ncbi:aminotransferase class I and II family protein, partial [Vibrio parahaemolyticus V-223/04]